MLAIIVGLIGAIVLIILISTLLGNNTSAGGLITIAQEQNELIRVSTEATGNASLQGTQNLIANIELSITTEQQDLLAYLKSIGKEPSQSTLALTKNSATDSALTTAQTNGNYDSTFMTIIRGELRAYSIALKQTFASTTNTAQRQLINNDYKAANILIAEANSTSNN